MVERNIDGSNVLIVIGMHRSGTSLVASILHSAGLDLGEQLMRAHETNNAKGFWENLDFVRFHEKVLESLGESRFGWTSKTDLHAPKEFDNEVDELLARNAREIAWGWKDPRSTLFLNYWAERLPKASFLFVHRPPWEVVDSLYRRGDPTFQDAPRLAVETWCNYNRAIIDFHKNNKQRGFMAGLSSIVNNSELFIEKINGRFNLNLKAPAKDIFDEKLIERSTAKTNRALAVQHFFPEARAIYKELVDLSEPIGDKPETAPNGAEPSQAELADCFLAEWVTTRRAERELKSGNKTLYEVRSELFHTSEKLNSLEKSRIWKIRNLVQGLRQKQN